MQFNESSPLTQQQLTQLARGQIAINSNGNYVLAGPGFIVYNNDYHYTADDDEAAFVISPPLQTGAYTSWGNQMQTNEPQIVPANNVSPGQAYEVWNAVALSNNSAWVIDGLGDVLEQDFKNGTLVYGGQKKAAVGGWKLVAGAASLPTQPAAVPPPAGGQGVAAIDLSSGTVAVIVGSQGLITRSVDKGNTWVTATPLTSANLQAVAIVADGPSAGTGWAVGTAATILRTTDAGASWTAQSWSDPTITAANVSFTAISTLDGNSAWITAQQANCSKDCGFVIHTSDGGTTWTRQPTGADGLNSVVMIDANTAWVVGLTGKILKTVTGGTVPSPL
jgi:hypothetical protein